MKKKTVYTLILCFFSAISIFAQSSQRAKNYLNEVTKKINSYKNVSIDFTYSVRSDKSDDQNQDSSGHIDIQNDLYLLEFIGIKKIYDGKKIYTISDEDEEVTIANYKENSNEGLLPSHMLTFFKEGFNYQWDILQNTKGRKIQYIKLTPTDSKSKIKEVLLGIDDDTKNIYTKIQINKNGQKSILTVNSFKTNQPISKNHFTFTESMYPSYYINKID
ncbi:LolA family protein [Myroides injenensis]|uniref:LolA family protein n=1 Tax=Myroides injenensis TaxID=1183151 RepID=UPI000289102F|nr:outer membrane lipoprotein carrier protein LolA [Myroides injenensis]